MSDADRQMQRPAQISGLSNVADPGPPPTSSSPPGGDGSSVRSIRLTPSSTRPGEAGAAGGGPGDDDGDTLSRAFWRSKQTTAAYCASFWAFGMCVAFLGPTLRDLGCKTGSKTSTMSWIFFSQALFILIGSACGGTLIERLTVNPILLISTLMLAVTLSLIPLCNLVGLLALVMAIMGFFMGIIDTVANVSMIVLYGRMVAPFLQTLHFFYGMGAFLSPMIAKPFLLNEDCTFFLISNNSSLPSNVSEPAKTLEQAQKMTEVDYAFWVMAALQIPVIGQVAVLLFTDLYRARVRKREAGSLGGAATTTTAKNQVPKVREEYESVELSRKDRSRSPNAAASTPGDDNHPPASKKQTWLLTGLTAVLLFLFDGLQAAYGGYVYSYAVKNFAAMSAAEAAYINSYFWGTFALGRLVSIPIATKVSPAVMLFCNITGCELSMLMLLIWNQSRVVLYLGSCLFGAFLSSVYPTAISLTERYIRITSGITSAIVVGAAGGEMMFPVIVGHQFDESPVVFLEIGFVVTLFSLFIYGAILVTGSTIMRKAGAPGLVGALLALFSIQSSDSDGEDTGLVNRHVKYYSRMGHESVDDEAEPVEVTYGESIEINREG